MQTTLSLFADVAGYWHKATATAAILLAGIEAGVVVLRALGNRGEDARQTAILVAILVSAVFTLLIKPGLSAFLFLPFLALATIPRERIAKKRAALELMAAATLEHLVTLHVIDILSTSTSLARMLQVVLSVVATLTLMFYGGIREYIFYISIIFLNAIYQAVGGLDILTIIATTMLTALVALYLRLNPTELVVMSLGLPILAITAALAPTPAAVLLRLLIRDNVNIALEINQGHIVPMPPARLLADIIISQLERLNQGERATPAVSPNQTPPGTPNTTAHENTIPPMTPNRGSLTRVNVILCGRNLGEYLLPPDATLRELSEELGLCNDRSRVRSVLVPGKGFIADPCAPVEIPDGVTVSYAC